MGDFSLRVNGKKQALPNQPYELTFKSLKDPNGTANQGGREVETILNGGQADNNPSFPTVVRMPIERKRAMQQRVQRASLPEGDRALPQAGLLFFEYRGSLRAFILSS